LLNANGQALFHKLADVLEPSSQGNSQGLTPIRLTDPTKVKPLGSLSMSLLNLRFAILEPLHCEKMGAFRLRPEFWVHRLRTTKTINRITTIVPAKP
jgi:hypothetical protein